MDDVEEKLRSAGVESDPARDVGDVYPLGKLIAYGNDKRLGEKDGMI